MSKSSSPSKPSSRQQPARNRPVPAPEEPAISARWLATAVGLVFACALLCVWGALCLVFWQGSWQLLYHPKTAIARTPAAVGLAFEPVEFATTDTGTPQLQGWWIP